MTGENMDTDVITVPDSNDLVSKEAIAAVPSVTDSEDLVSKEEGHVAMPAVTDSDDLVSKEEGRMVVPSVTVNEGSKEPGVEINKEVKLDAKFTEENHGDGVREIDVSIGKSVESSLATEKPFSEDVVVEADIETCSEPKAELGIVAEVAEEETAEDADAVNKECLDQNVIDNSIEASLRPCSITAKQSSSDLSGQKVADVSDTPSDLSGQKVADASDSPSLVEASTVIGGVVTEETSSLCKLNIQKGDDATADHEMNKETVVKGNKQDELPAIAGGDRPTGCDVPLATAPYAEMSVNETQ